MTPTLGSIALICVLASSGGSQLPVFTEDYWVIVAGSKNQKETESQLAKIMKRWPASVELSGGYPKIMSSDGKRGLNPGFIIAVAGMCSDEFDAVAVRNEIRKAFPGAYVRKVARYLPGFIPNCPRLEVKPPNAKSTPEVPTGFTLKQEGPAERDGLLWKTYSAETECGRSVLVQLLGRDGRLVDERLEKAHCVKGDPEGPGSGESKFWSATIVGDEREKTRYVMLTYEMWASDTGCSGGVALCPTTAGMTVEKLELDGLCTSSPYNAPEDEKHCNR